MPAGDILRSSEKSALTNNQFVTNVTNRGQKFSLSKKIKSFGAMGFITIVLGIFVLLFSSGNLLPAAISDRLIEETDVQYADAVESKKLVFQQAMREGKIPSNTANILNQNGVLVGYIKDDEFIEGNNTDGELVLKMSDEIITADNFITTVNNNPSLYNAFNDATYGRAAYYYDEAANDVFRQIGTNRNNYSADSDFDEVMNDVVGSGSDIDVNSVSIEEKIINNNGESETITEYVENGEAISSKAQAETFVSGIGGKVLGSTTEQATLQSADILKTSDTIAKEQKSSLFFLAFMENISKMKAGEGDESKINEAMDYIYQEHESEVVDVKTGEIIKVTGAAVDSPSLYSILSGNNLDVERVQNYSSDRVLKTVENQLGVNNSGNIIANTIASVTKGIKGVVGRLLGNYNATTSEDILNKVTPIIESSLVNNSFDTISGINAGEFLVEGAVNVGGKLARASGATAGDAESITKYALLNSTVLAMDAEADRINRSPFDISSKNTFLGSILYKVAFYSLTSQRSSLTNIKSFSSMLSSAMIGLMPDTYADSIDGYLSNFGDCETISRIGAMGSPQCVATQTFDTSTLNNPFNDQGFKDFVEANTTLSNGTRKINSDSVLAEFIKNNDERITSVGIMDGGILNDSDSGSTSISLVSDITEMIKSFNGASEAEKRKASGEAYVNSSANPDWQTYKYAQRYVSLARATSALKQYSDDGTAYNNLKFFEGTNNPVTAFVKEYRKVANR